MALASQRWRVVDRAAALLQSVVLLWYMLESIKFVTGVDVVKAITEAPPFDPRKVVAEYPWLFNGLVLALGAVAMIDQALVAQRFSGRPVPPPQYGFVVSLALASLSITLFIFLRWTTLGLFYVYFAVLGVLGAVGSLLTMRGMIPELMRAPPSPVVAPEQLVRREGQQATASLAWDQHWFSIGPRVRRGLRGS